MERSNFTTTVDTGTESTVETKLKRNWLITTWLTILTILSSFIILTAIAAIIGTDMKESTIHLVVIFQIVYIYGALGYGISILISSILLFKRRKIGFYLFLIATILFVGANVYIYYELFCNGAETPSESDKFFALYFSCTLILPIILIVINRFILAIKSKGKSYWKSLR